jgi:hypothetical protein
VGPHGVGFEIPTHPIGYPMGWGKNFDDPMGWVLAFRPTHWVTQWVAKNPTRDIVVV